MREGTLSPNRSVPAILLATAIFWAGGIDDTASPRGDAEAPAPVLEREAAKSDVRTVKAGDKPAAPVRLSPERERKHDQLRLMQRLPAQWLA